MQKPGALVLFPVVIGVLGALLVMSRQRNSGASLAPSVPPAAPSMGSETAWDDPGAVPGVSVSGPEKPEPGVSNEEDAAGTSSSPSGWDLELDPKADSREGSMAEFLRLWTIGVEDEETLAQIDAVLEEEARYLAGLVEVREALDEIAQHYRAEFDSGLHAGHTPSQLCGPACPKVVHAGESEHAVTLRAKELRRLRTEAIERLRVIAWSRTREGIIVDSMEPVEEGR